MTIEITDEMVEQIRVDVYGKDDCNDCQCEGSEWERVEIRSYLTAALPIIEKQVRAAWAEEIRAIEVPEHNLHDQLPSDHWYAGQKIMRDEIAALLEGGAE